MPFCCICGIDEGGDCQNESLKEITKQMTKEIKRMQVTPRSPKEILGNLEALINPLTNYPTKERVGNVLRAILAQALSELPKPMERQVIGHEWNTKAPETLYGQSEEAIEYYNAAIADCKAVIQKLIDSV